MEPKTTKAAILGCVDNRHDSKDGRVPGGQLEDTVRTKTGKAYSFFRMYEPGGAGILSKSVLTTHLLARATTHPLIRAWALYKIKLAINKLGVEEIVLAVHGSSDEDPHGCGGYKVSGYAAEYETPERSREFSHSELRRAAALLKRKGITLPITAFYVTFGKNGENILEEVSLKESALA